MNASVPAPPKTTMPDVLHGEIYQNIGKYARGAIMFAFHEVGGPNGLATWAKDNKDDFYTKLFPKIVTRESEVHHVKTLDDLMDVIDGDYTVPDEEDAIDMAPVLTHDYQAEFGPDDEPDDYAAWDIDSYVDFPDE